MKSTEVTTTDSGIKVTVTRAVDADGIERITSTASTKKSGKLLLFQTVKVKIGGGRFKTLYTQQRTDKQSKVRLRDLLTWIKLGYHTGKVFSKTAENT